jgi:hypothetical protein
VEQTLLCVMCIKLNALYAAGVVVCLQDR